MGRYFRSSKPQFIDFMYDLPETQMYNLLAAVDKNVDQTFSDIEKLRFNYSEDTKNNFGTEYLPADQIAAKKRIDEFETQIDELTKKVQSNPLEYRNVTGDISRLRTDIKSDLMYGELATYSNQLSAVKDWRIRQKDSKISGNEIATMEAAMMNQWNKNGGSQYDRESGNYIPITSILEDIAPGDLRTSALEYGSKVKENSNYKHILNTTFEALMTDENLHAHLAQQWKFGMLPDEVTVDDKGKTITKKVNFDEFKTIAALKEAKLAADLYYKKEKPTGGGSGSTENTNGWPAAPSKQNMVKLTTGIQELMNSDYNKDASGNIKPLTFENFMTAYNGKSTAFRARYSDEQRNGMMLKGQELYDVMNEKIELQILEAVLQDIDKQTPPVNDNLPDAVRYPLIEERKRKMDQALVVAMKGRGVEVKSSWNREGISEQEAKDIMLSVKSSIEEFDQWKSAILVADDNTPALQGATLEGMINSGDLKYGDDSADVIKGLQGNYGDIVKNPTTNLPDIRNDNGITSFKLANGDSIEIRKDNDNFVRAYRTKTDGSTVIEPNSATAVKIDQSKGFSNFKIYSENAIPTTSPNDNGEMMWRVPVNYNGTDGAIYIPMRQMAGHGIWNDKAAEMYSPTAFSINSSVDKFYNNNIPVGTKIQIEDSGNFKLWFTRTEPNAVITLNGQRYTANSNGVVMWGASGGKEAIPVTDKAEQVGLMELYYNTKK